MHYWWVNQGNSAYNKHALSDLWAAYRDVDSKRQAHWDALDAMVAGDIVLHYAKGRVLGASRVRRTSHRITRPAEFEVEGRAGGDGRRVIVDFQPFDVEVPLADIPLDLRHTGQGPFRAGGGVRRGYVFPVSAAVTRIIFDAANLFVVPSQSGGLVEEADADHRELVLMMDETDGTALARYRKEQGALRKRLIGNRQEASCGLCGKVYPVSLLNAAHIKPRSVASETERRDLANVMLACLAGCDALFEQGYIHLADDGTIVSQALPPEDSALAALVRPLLGTRAPAFGAHNGALFRWKREHSPSRLEA